MTLRRYARRWMRRTALVAITALSACRPAPDAAPDREWETRADSLWRTLATTTGLPAGKRPALRWLDRASATRWIAGAAQSTQSSAWWTGLEVTYRAIGLWPDSAGSLLDAAAALTGAEVAGLYNPRDHEMLLVRDTPEAMLRLVLAHELVHALQHQSLPAMDSLGTWQTRDMDRATALQATLEGHAVWASVTQILPRGVDLASAWPSMVPVMRDATDTLSQWKAAPRALREGLLFPYTVGTSAILQLVQDGSLPGPLRPWPSTAAVMRAASGLTRPVAPVMLRPASPRGVVPLVSSPLGAFDLQLALQSAWGGPSALDTVAARAWRGDRVTTWVTSATDTAVTWESCWDSPNAAQAVAARLTRLGHGLPPRLHTTADCPAAVVWQARVR